MRGLGLWLLLGCALLAGPGPALDPAAVQRLGPAYRYPQAGWIVVHIEGKPFERGLQHGRLLAPEIAGHLLCLATARGPRAPEQAWAQQLSLVDGLFLRGFSPEQLEEMKGIAEGASAAGARFYGRPIGLLDIAAINCANELESLDAAVKVTATGLENLQIPAGALPAPAARARPQHCNAFAAVGKATRDGGIVFGHTTMWELYPAQFYNVWLEIRPDQGHRFVMQTTPGGMHSGMDYAINDAGILMSETTLEQTAFEPKGRPLAARIRQAEQYAENIDQVVAALAGDGNGLATSEWILADLKANEIALFTLGTHRSVLHRSSKAEWFPGAEGFYWSCNNTKDAAVRLETAPGLASRPSAAGAFEPSRRDELWLELFNQHKGRIDESFAQLVLTRPELVAPLAVDSKYTTTAMARQLQTWAAFGPPAGGSRWPSPAETRDFPQILPLVRQPWTFLAMASPKAAAGVEPAVDIHDPLDATLPAPPAPVAAAPRPPAWHGTLLPASDADVWLSTAFANYERIVALTLGGSAPGQLGSELFYWRSLYEWGGRAGQERPLAQGDGSIRTQAGFQQAAGKGVLVLHALRELLGGDRFDPLMDSFGKAHAGQPVSTAQFRAHLARGAGRDLDGFFRRWLEQPGLPQFRLGAVTSRRRGQDWETTVEVERDALGQDLPVPVTVETGEDELTRTVVMAGPRERLALLTEARPEQVVLDKYGLAARGGGAPFTILTCETELDRTLIVYGSRDEAEANLETAGVLQQALKRREFNLLVPIRKDSEVTENELRDHHLLLIGRPDSNSLVARFQAALPVTFGVRSFEVRGDRYANPGSAVLTAVENPLNRRYSMVVLAGLGGTALLKVAARFQEEAMPYVQTLVLPWLGEEEWCVLAAREMTRTPGENR